MFDFLRNRESFNPKRVQGVLAPTTTIPSLCDKTRMCMGEFVLVVKREEWPISNFFDENTEKGYILAEYFFLSVVTEKTIYWNHFLKKFCIHLDQYARCLNFPKDDGPWLDLVKTTSVEEREKSLYGEYVLEMVIKPGYLEDYLDKPLDCRNPFNQGKNYQMLEIKIGNREVEHWFESQDYRALFRRMKFFLEKGE